ncbi:deleted in malignant brain tumors 1 protein isoform X2 [Esox lucius]|uniref:deleted in malignant brain tumors 1 protein isoform X2 n=1 Tax=Esox lucius TaxID=8010 RepID=UPI001476B245|nr:deleted in malignant brain tumors 1 protein isoform X2 [Esox lucius]
MIINLVVLAYIIIMYSVVNNLFLSPSCIILYLILNDKNTITNSFSPESVRLVDGAGFCSGRLEVKSSQSWVSVCESDFDQQDAEVVCRELGCGVPVDLQGGLYGEGEGQTWDKEFQCKGNETRLLDCDTSDRKNNICLPGHTVGLNCSEPDNVRLVGEASRCAGRVELYHQEEWRIVGIEDINLYGKYVSAVVCRQLGCGTTISVLPGNRRTGTSVYCNGSEPGLRECSTWISDEYRMYIEPQVFTVICSDLLVQPDFYLTDSMGGVSRSHQGPEIFRGYSFTITCSTQPQYPGGSFLFTFPGSNRTQTQTQPAVNHSAVFLFPAADDSHQGNYRCVYNNYVFSHNFSSESQLLFLTITASPHPAFIIRHVIVLLILLTVIITSCLNYKSTRGQKRVNRVSSMDLHVSTNVIEMVSLDSRTDAGPGEETAVQETE